MNQGQVAIINDLVKDMSTNEYWNEVIERVYPNADPTSLQMNDMILSDYLYLVKKVFSNFIIICNNKNLFLSLPYVCSVIRFDNGNPLGAQQVSQLISNFKTLVSQGNLAGSIANLYYLVSYQQMFNVYHLEDRALIEMASIEYNKNQVNTLVQEISNKKNEFDKKLELYKGELALINENKVKLDEHLNKITSIEKDLADKRDLVIEHTTTIKNLTDQHVQEWSNFKSEKDNLQDAILNLNKQMTTQHDEYNSFQEKYSFHLTEIDDLQKMIIERREELNKLIGLQVGVSLNHTFERRKKQLFLNSTIWMALLFSSIILLTFLTSQMFSEAMTMLSDAAKNDNQFWYKFAGVSSLKSIPFILFIFYCITQYGKERNFQEQYAFKSAVALTINSYADRIKDEAIKDKMIVDSIEKVYDSPILKEKINKKDLNVYSEILKPMVDAVSKKILQ